MEKRDFIRLSAATAITAAMPKGLAAQTAAEKPNMIFILCDQRSFGYGQETGFLLDTNPR